MVYTKYLHKKELSQTNPVSEHAYCQAKTETITLFIQYYYFLYGNI